MLYYGLEWQSLDSYFQFKEISAPATPEANEIRLYAKDSGGISTLCYKNDAGTEICFPTSGGFVTGSGTDNQVAIWNGTSAIDAFAATAGSVLFAGVSGILAQDNANLFWDDSNNRLGVGTATPNDRLEVNGVGRFAQRVQIIGVTTPTTRGGVEIGHDTGQHGFLESFETTTATYERFLIAAQDFLVNVGTSPATRLQVDTTGNTILGGGTSASELRLLEPSGSGTNYTAFKAQAQAANVSYTLPAADGSVNTVLTTNGSATLTWGTTMASLTIASGGSVDLSAIAAGSPNLVITATTDTPVVAWTGGGSAPTTAPAGYLEITVGGSSRYIPFWA